MPRVILDTDVASLSIKQRLPPALLSELLGAQIGITFVTLGELTRWATLRQWGPTRRAELDGWLATRPTLPYTSDVARLCPSDGRRRYDCAGDFRRASRP